MLNRLIDALKNPVNDAIDHWVERSGIVGIFTSFGLAVKEGVEEAEEVAAELLQEAQELEQSLEQAADIVDYAASLSMVAVILLIVSHLFKIYCSHLQAKNERLNARLKKIQIKQAESDNADHG